MLRRRSIDPLSCGLSALLFASGAAANGGPGSESRVYGGFYTQAELRDIVAYAGARHIAVVPEVDLPEHA